MKLTLRPLVVLICVGALVGVWALRSNAPRAARPTSGQGIVVFGDSLVAGRGASAGQDFVSVLSRRLGTTIVNAGQSGDTTGAALARLERDVLALNPRIVVVLLGGNDYLRRVPVTQTFSNLDSIVDQIREHGPAATRIDAAAVQLDERLHQRESDAEDHPENVSSEVIHLRKHVEQAWQMFRGNAIPFSRDANDRLVIRLSSTLSDHVATGGRGGTSHALFKRFPIHLCQPRGVGVELRRSRVARGHGRLVGFMLLLLRREQLSSTA